MRKTDAALAILLTVACQKAPLPSTPWTWHGANQYNTMWFSQSGTRPGRDIKYGKAWEAELFTPPEEELPIVAAVRNWGLMTVDCDEDGELEIIAAPAGIGLTAVYDRHGLPDTAAEREWPVGSRVVLDTEPADSSHTASPRLLALDSARARGTTFAVRLNGRPVVV